VMPLRSARVLIRLPMPIDRVQFSRRVSHAEEIRTATPS